MDVNIDNITSSEFSVEVQTKKNSNSNSNSKYEHHKKMDLVKKINKIKKKEYLVNIFKIITLGRKDYTENTNGVFIFFHNLDDETYEKLENYVSLIYKLHKKSNSLDNILTSELSELSELSDTNAIYSDNNLIEKIQINSINNELSNKEKMIMRRKQYEDYLTQNQRL